MSAKGWALEACCRALERMVRPDYHGRFVFVIKAGKVVAVDQSKTDLRTNLIDRKEMAAVSSIRDIPTV